MRYLFVVGHPAHVHLFRNVAHSLLRDGHEVLFGAVAREVTVRLLEANGIEHFEFGSVQAAILAKGFDMFRKDLTLLHEARRYKPDLLVSTGSPYAAHVSAILSKPHLAFGDTEHATLIAHLALPFTDAICTPSSFKGYLGPRQVRYNGYKELAYLHPRYFSPDPSVLDRLGLSRNEPYILLRFSSWDASHDIGGRGFGFTEPAQASRFMRALESHGRVVITSEKTIRKDLNRYSLPIPPEKMHDVLAYARLYAGEGATMAAEAGILGVPWIFVSTTGRGFLSDQQSRYSLGFWETSGAAAQSRAEELLSTPEWKALWQLRRTKMLSEKVDVTRFLFEFIERWPDSYESAIRGQLASAGDDGGR